MQPTAFRRVWKSLSPRKHLDSKNPHISSPTNVTHSRHPPTSHSPASSSPSSTRSVSPPPSSPPCPSSSSASVAPAAPAAVEEQYARFLARLSTRAEQADVSPVPPRGPLSRSPPASPSRDDRALSRLHRRAMRDITMPRLAAANSGSRGRDAAGGSGKEDEVMREVETEGGMEGGMEGVMGGEGEVEVQVEVESARPALPLMYVGVNPLGHFSDFVPVGNGASGTVFFARRQGGERVALKKVTPSTRAKSRALENEIRTMHVLRHRNIVQCHEAYSFEGSVWIVMEAMDVGCLTHVLDFLRNKAYLLSESHIAYILRETLLGLWTMHSHNRMHRDIKSDNILVSSTGEIKLADFEYTAVLTEDTPKRNTVVGTAWWMAPETVRSSYYDYGADVWSIGILSVECAEWVPPLFGMESAKAMEVIRAGQTIQGFKRPDMWSPEFADFVRGCLTRDRDMRYSVPELLRHPFLEKACTKTQIANVFRAVRGMEPIVGGN